MTILKARGSLDGLKAGSREKFASASHLVTGHLVVCSFFLQGRLGRLALTHANGTTGFEAATSRRIERECHFAFEWGLDVLSERFHYRVRGQKGLGIGV